jgi:5-methylcytosine-specific restriction protein A
LQETFKNKQDQNYLEAHHINFLSEGGKDQEDNLIALCPNCHRKAHFSKEKREFQQDLRNIVDKYKSKNPYISLPNNL